MEQRMLRMFTLRAKMRATVAALSVTGLAWPGGAVAAPHSRGTPAGQGFFRPCLGDYWNGAAEISPER